jgi:hypothetical protein
LGSGPICSLQHQPTAHPAASPAGVLVGMGRSGIGAGACALSALAVALPMAIIGAASHTWPGCRQLWAGLAAMHVLQAVALAWQMDKVDWWVAVMTRHSQSPIHPWCPLLCCTDWDQHFLLGAGSCDCYDASMSHGGACTARRMHEVVRSKSMISLAHTPRASNSGDDLRDQQKLPDP